MSRQFKFRAWNKASKEMVDFTFGDLKASDSDEDVLLPNDHRLLEHTVIMQYLGAECKDKNGAELCEGDLIVSEEDFSFDEEDEEFCNPEDINKIVYSEFGAGFHLEGSHDEDETIACDGFIKIGNIYENPELLEVK